MEHNSGPDSDVCNCDCHRHTGETQTMHRMACCNICPHCEQNIAIHAYKRHVSRCEKNKGSENHQTAFEQPSRQPQLGSSPAEDPIFRRLTAGARELYGCGGGGSSDAGDAD